MRGLENISFRIPDASLRTLTTTNWLVFLFSNIYADVAELADALDLGWLVADATRKPLINIEFLSE